MGPPGAREKGVVRAFRKTPADIAIEAASEKEKAAGELVKQGQIKQAIWKYGECAESIVVALEGIGPGSDSYRMLKDAQRGINDNISMLSAFFCHMSSSLSLQLVAVAVQAAGI